VSAVSNFVFPTELESEKCEAGFLVRSCDQLGLLLIERHADGLRRLVDAHKRSICPPPPLRGIGREHDDHVVQVSGIGDGVASSVKSVVQVGEALLAQARRSRAAARPNWRSAHRKNHPSSPHLATPTKSDVFLRS